MAGFRFRVPLGAAVLVVAATMAVASQRSGGSASRPLAPTGQEIAAAARAARLDPAGAIATTMFGRPFKFTPARMPTRAEAESQKIDIGLGLFAGVLENGERGDETGLPPGKYNLFVANVAGRWKGYAEANGRIVAEAIRTTVNEIPESAATRPQFVEKGWCIRWTMCFWSMWGYIKCYSVLDCY